MYSVGSTGRASVNYVRMAATGKVIDFEGSEIIACLDETVIAQ